MKQFKLFIGKALLAAVAVAAVTLQVPSFAAAASGGPAAEQVRNCEAGIAALDPDKTTECLDQRILEAFAAENPGRGIKLLAQANTIKNLSDCLSISQNTGTLRRALLPALEPGTPAAALGLAPEADKFLAWVKKYRPGKLVMAQEAVLKWSTLPPEQQSWLGKNGVTVPAWEAAPLGSVKYELLAKYAEAEAAALIKTPAPADMAGSASECPSCGVSFEVPFFSDAGTLHGSDLEHKPSDVIKEIKSRTIRIEVPDDV